MAAAGGRAFERPGQFLHRHLDLPIAVAASGLVVAAGVALDDDQIFAWLGLIVVATVGFLLPRSDARWMAVAFVGPPLAVNVVQMPEALAALVVVAPFAALVVWLVFSTAQQLRDLLDALRGRGTAPSVNAATAPDPQAASVASLRDLIALSHAAWMPRVVEAVLGTNDADAVAETLERAVADAMGVAVTGARFYDPGVGIVAGLELADGRAVVAKVHRATFVSRERLDAIARVQADVARAGVPAPAPLSGPAALGEGWLTVEALLAGDVADGYDPSVRGAMAAALHALVDAARRHAGDDRLGRWLVEPAIDGLWPQPHDLRFDLPGTRAGAEWIDDAARTARAALTGAAGPDVVGHLDWRVQNLAFADGRVTAIYDWDSVHLVPEPALVGSASVVHPIDWRLDLPDPLPTLEQLDGFVADYESARGVLFDDEERAVLTAGQRWVAAYGARCQHSDDVLGLFPDVDHSRGWPRLLRELLGR